MLRRVPTVVAVALLIVGLSPAVALAATLTVTTTADDSTVNGNCTLREAITAANTNVAVDACTAGASGSDTIGFNIPGTGQHTIATASQLPTIVDPVTIDGFTDPDDDGRIELDGTIVVGDQGLVLGTGSSQSTIRGLVINDFDEGVVVVSDQNTIEGNYLGTTPSGNAADANGTGIRISGDTNTVGGTTVAARNVVSANTNNGVNVFTGATGNQIQGNYVGVGADGTTDLGNGLAGFLITGNTNTIGGSAAGARNIISGNTTLGINISDATGNVVQGNYIGLEPDGSTAEPNGNGGIAFFLAASNNTIGGTAAGAGNVISGNGGTGIGFSGALASSNTIQGNFIGTTATGLVARGNGSDGIQITSPSTTIGGSAAGAGNVISGNLNDGIDIGAEGGDNTVIKGNTIGLGSDGATDLGNTTNGVRVFNSASGEVTANTTIGGTAAGEGNLISGNGFDGIDVGGIAIDGVTIRGNRIGTDATGALDRGNDGHGIDASAVKNLVVGGTVAGAGNLVSGNGDTTGTDFGLNLVGFPAGPYVVQGNRIGTNAAGTAAIPNADAGANIQGNSSVVGGTTGVTPGGSCTGACNLISGNTGFFTLDVSTSATVQGNYIGTDVTGLQDLGNTGSGISGSTDSTVVTIGGDTAQERNIISGNGGAGIGMFDSGAHNDVIQGNYIGVGTDGETPLGNGDEGIVYGGDGNTIGGTVAGEGNVIAHNGAEGVSLATTATGNAVLRNRIFSNGSLGIDLDRDATIEPNDAGDADTGSNLLQNYPVLTSAEAAANVVTVNGTFNSTPSSSFRVEFFNNEACNAASPNDFGEGAAFLGFSDVTTDAGGNATFTFTSTGTPAVAVGDMITATATDGGDNTSEFSKCLVTTPTMPTLSIDDVTVTEGNAGTVHATFTVTRSGDTSGTSSAQYTTANGTATAPSDYQSTSGTVTFAPTDTTETVVVTVNGDAVDEPTETFTVNLSNPSEATISDGQGMGTILDDDAPRCPGFESDPRPQLVGTDGANTLTGSSAAEIVCGLGGNDVLKGGGGKDLVLGGGGNDRMAGQGGKDVLKGQAGNDKMNGGPGVDRCQGGPGKDSAKACEKGRA